MDRPEERDGLFSGHSDLDQTRFNINWENVRVQGLSYNFAIGYHGLDYNPGLGFETRRNMVESWYDVKYGWNAREEAKLLRHLATFENNYYYNILYKQRESIRNSLRWGFEYKSGWFFGVNTFYHTEQVFEAFEIGEITIEEADYRGFDADLWVASPGSALLMSEAYISGGRFFGGSRYTVGLAPTWSVVPGFILSGFYECNRLDLGSRGSETIQVGRLRALWMIDTKLSGAAFVQYNSAAHIWAGNFRLRYNPREGNDLYIVFNENLNTDRERELPFLPASRGHTVVVKYTHTLLL